MCEVVSGRYEVSGKIIQIIGSRRFTPEKLHALGGAVRAARAGVINEDQLVSRLESIDPKLGEAAKDIKTNSKGLGLLVGVLMICLSRCNFNAELDVNELYNQVFNSPQQQTGQVSRPPISSPPLPKPKPKRAGKHQR
jgi:hypothetical protein